MPTPNSIKPTTSYIAPAKRTISANWRNLTFEQQPQLAVTLAK